jgi:hypothetical protein
MLVGIMRPHERTIEFCAQRQNALDEASLQIRLYEADQVLSSAVTRIVDSWAGGLIENLCSRSAQVVLPQQVPAASGRMITSEGRSVLLYLHLPFNATNDHSLEYPL